MALLIRGGRVLAGTPAALTRADVLIEGDRIAAVGPHPDPESVTDAAGSAAGKPAGRPPSGEIRVDLSGRQVVPGYVDLHVHGLSLIHI